MADLPLVGGPQTLTLVFSPQPSRAEREPHTSLVSTGEGSAHVVCLEKRILRRVADQLVYCQIRRRCSFLADTSRLIEPV